MIVLCRLLRQAKIESRPEMPQTDSPFSAVPPDELAEHVHHIVFLVVPFLQKSLGTPAVFFCFAYSRAGGLSEGPYMRVSVGIRHREVSVMG